MNPFDFTGELKKDIRLESNRVTLIVTFFTKIVIIDYKYIYGAHQQKERRLTNLSPQYAIQGKEKEHPRKIGRQVSERTFPARHQRLRQLYERPIAEGEEHCIDVGWLETGAKGNIEQDGGKKIGNKVGDLIPLPPQIYPF